MPNKCEYCGGYCTYTRRAMPIKTYKELCQEALDVQNACNLCGVAQSFARAMLDLGEHIKPHERNAHPITIAWIDKLSSLAGVQAWDNYSKARILDAFDKVEAGTK